MIRASAPVRVCDAGGWTDTWFAREGSVCSVAMAPGAHVPSICGAIAGPVVLTVGVDGRVLRSAASSGAAPGRHPLLEAALQRHPVPDNRVAGNITVGAAVPPGLRRRHVGGGDRCARPCTEHRAAAKCYSPTALARHAHQIEIGLGLQSGVQDQYAGDRGGANLIHVGPYPTAVVEPLELPTPSSMHSTANSSPCTSAGTAPIVARARAGHREPRRWRRGSDRRA